MKRIKRWTLILLTLFAIQLITYFTIAPKLLKNKLLTNYFGELTHHADTAFVRDFFIAECTVSETGEWFSHELKRDEELLKKKLRVKHVYIQTPEEFSWNHHPEKQYKLAYFTYAHRPNWVEMLVYLFPTEQHEALLVDKKYSYTRTVTYHWCLFFWVRTFEWFVPGDCIVE